jgi:hypothetical protein
MQDKSKMADQLTTGQWTQLLSLLSLDCVLPFYQAMGLPVGDKSVFQLTLRGVILDARKFYAANPDRVPDVAAELLKRLKSPESRSFFSWARGIFLGYHADQPNWSAWDIVISQWAYSRNRDLDFLSAQNLEFFLVGYRRDADTDDIKCKGGEALRSALSDWDLEMFSRHGYGASWETSPFQTIESIVRIERLKIFVRKIWLMLSLVEQEQFQLRAQVLVDQLKVWMPGPLPRLDDLLRGR